MPFRCELTLLFSPPIFAETTIFHSAMTKDTFGESLKREREMRGVTLEEVSSATRIATRFLKAIEDEQWDQLPGGVFNRGFVRAVARYLGLDEENIVAEYTLAVGDRQTVPVWTGRPPAVTPEQPWLAWIIAAILAIALAAGGWYGARRFLLKRAEKKGGQQSSLGEAASSSTSSSLVPVADAPSNHTSTFSSARAPVSDPGGAATATSAPASDSLGASANGAAPTDRFELKVVAAKRTKVIVVADKDVVFDGTMKAGENHFFNATDHFQVSAKDAGVVHLELNGKTLAPIGPTGHEGKITLTRDALKSAPGGGN
jgi:cytoskeleton protein RodZ